MAGSEQVTTNRGIAREPAQQARELVESRAYDATES